MKLKLASKKTEVEGVETFVLMPEQPVDWQPGQYMHYVLPHDNADERGNERWFTIASAPYENHLQITTRLDGDPESSFKQALNSLKAGDSFETDGPKGSFTLKEGDFKHILIAGGIGITPYRSQLAQLAHDNQPANADLLYLNRDANFVFDNELESYAAKDQTLKIKKFIDKKLTAEDLKPYADDPKSVFYLSGPRAMVEAYESMLGEDLNVAKDHIITDYFPGY